jgi:1-deoxy-D-xylulose-5-phosphate reductoisomerase
VAPLRVAIAGSTGSIGTQTLDVVRAEGPDRYQVVALGVGSSVEALVAQAREFAPSVVAVADPAARARVAEALPGVEVVADQADLVGVADVVINGVVGFAGLPVTIETLRAGKRLGLANKESLIAAGPVVQPLRSTPGAELVPVDSEHCAIHQCLRSSVGFDSGSHREVARIVLTASGGPFRGRSAADLATVTVEQALAHPTWAMGPKITVDSSTLMNKGLEVIEAHELFGISYDRIDVVVHPQSVVHSMAEFTDGSTIAQLSMPDMRLPIGYALGYPDRIGTPYGRIDWTTLGRLDFEPPDTGTFRCLSLAYEAGRIGGTAPAWLSAANEIAVEAFLDGRLSWNQIADVSVAVLEDHDGGVPTGVDDVIAADAEARRLATTVVQELQR